MANDKDFIVKNAVEVGGSTKTTLGTVTNDDIDLSTGNYFAHSPSGATTYTISNAATNQSFQLEVTGGAEEVAQNFSTTLYTGTSADRDITNNIDLATDGGMVWIKSRTSTTTAFIFDTERGATKSLTPSETGAQETDGNTLKTFNTDGFSTGSSAKVNGSNDYVSWAFKKAAGFFDIVTYTGNGATQNVSHNLGSDVGMLIIKSTSAGNWFVWHRSLGDNAYLFLNGTNAQQLPGFDWIDVTSTTISLQNNSSNTNGQTFVAYLFAHDTASDGLIQCGSYTTDANEDATVTLGWKPSWLLVKRSDSSTGGDWRIIDSVRGVTAAGDAAYLEANTSDPEAQTGDGRYTFTDTGFTQDNFGASRPYIYVAIRSAADLDLTWPTSIEWAGGVTPAAPATGETDLFSISTDDGGTTYQGFKVADNLS